MDNFTWRWVFFINVPIIAITIWLLVQYVPESRNQEDNTEIHWLGAILVSLGLGGIAFGLIQGPVTGWGSGTVIAGMAGGVVALTLFVLVELRIRSPMIPFHLFRSRNFTGANITTLGVYFALFGTTFFLVIYVQNVMEFSAFAAGLSLAPISLLMLIMSPRIGELAGRHGPRLFMTVGPFIGGIGLLLFTRLTSESSYFGGLLTAVIVLGIGLAITVAPLTDTVISSVPEKRAGVAAALNNVVSRVAALLAIAGLGVIVSGVFDMALNQRIANLSLTPSEKTALNVIAENPTARGNVSQLPPKAKQAVNEAYTQAFHWAMRSAAMLSFLAGGVAAGMIRNPNKLGYQSD